MTSETPVRHILSPWEANLYRLISWWDMEQLSGHNLSTVFNRLHGVQNTYKTDTHVLNEQEHEELREELATVVTLLNRSSLAYSAGVLQDFCRHLLNWKRKDFGPIDGREVSARMGEVLRSIQAEMTSSCFMYIPPKRAEYYGQDTLFGLDVFVRFEDARYDIREAGNCLASGRYTACVYHLMRALEEVLVVLGNEFGQPFDHANWQTAINTLEKKIRSMQDDPLWKGVPNWKDRREFYAQGISHLAIVKEAWRNYTMHARGKYTEDEAERMLHNVRAFMQGVAEKVSD